MQERELDLSAFSLALLIEFLIASIAITANNSNTVYPCLFIKAPFKILINFYNTILFR